MNFKRCMNGYCKTCPDDVHCPFDKPSNIKNKKRNIRKRRKGGKNERRI
mgnify:CR=1 FL=1